MPKKLLNQRARHVRLVLRRKPSVASRNGPGDSSTLYSAGSRRRWQYYVNTSALLTVVLRKSQTAID